MKLSVNQTNLSQALSIAGRAVNSRTTLPVLGNVLLQTDGDRLKVAATNREMSITTWIDATVEHDGAITIPARLLTEFTNSLPNGEIVNLNLTERTQTLKVECKKFKSNIKGIDHNGFPLLPTMPDDADLSTLDTARIGSVTFSAASDENRPTLTGVSVSANGEHIVMAATDGFRLSESVIESGAVFASVIIPSDALSHVARVAEGQPAEFSIADDKAFFVIGADDGVRRVEVVSKLIAARFPDYLGTVPKTHDTKAALRKADLLAATKVADLFARDNSHIVRYLFSDDGLTLAATSAEQGDSHSSIAATVDGPEIEIALNAKYMVDMLTNGDFGNEITIELTQPTRPILVNGRNGYRHVVMPMTLPR